MTEEEAKTKWCPFAQMHPNGWNRDTFDALEIRDPRCIGSECMAWRGTGSKFKDGRTGRLSDIDLTGHGTWISVGFCGLAGAPNA